jgi:hypothetical protein
MPRSHARLRNRGEVAFGKYTQRLVGKSRVQRTCLVAVQPYSMQVRLHLLPA